MVGQLTRFLSPILNSRTCAPVVSCEWCAAETFLVGRLFPDRHVISAHPFESARRVIRQLPSEMKFFLFHINGTRTDKFIKDRQLLLDAIQQRRAVALNATITDISKVSLQRALLEEGMSSTLASREGDPDEELMIKTDRNCKGDAEALLTPRQQLRLGYPALSQLMGSILAEVQKYPVLRRRDIPSAWWSEPEIVIERYICNAEDRFYRVHILRDCLAITDVVVPGTVKKLSAGVKAAHHYFTYAQMDSGEVPAPFHGICRQTRILQRRMAFDFAALDLVLDEAGTCFIVDLNTTPWAGQLRLDHPLLSHLRRGLATGEAEGQY